MNNKILYYTSWVILFTFLGLFIYIFYLLLYPYKVLEIKAQRINTPVVRQGEMFSVSIDYCKHMDIGGTISKTFVDGIVYSLVSSQTNRELGCHTVDALVQVPHNIPPSNYAIQTIYRYKVNSLREIEIKTTTDIFTVIEATPSAR